MGAHTARSALLAVVANNQTRLMEVEYEIELADIPKVFIQNFHKVVDDFKGYELIVSLINAHDKKEAGISLVDYLHCIQQPAQISAARGMRAAALIARGIPCCPSNQGSCRV